MSSDDTKTSPAPFPNPSIPEWSILLSDPRALRKYWLDTLSQVTDGYLRSVAFLELMHNGLEIMLEANGDTRR